MSDNNKIKQPLTMISIIIALLYVVSFIPTDTELFGLQLRQVDIFSDLKEEEVEDFYEEDDFFNEDNWYEDDTEESDSTEIIEDDNAASLKFNQSRYIKASVFDGEKISNAISAINNALMNQPTKPQTVSKKIVGNMRQLEPFFKELGNAKNKQVRIAHFGDSQIEGDLVTADLRENLRKKVGGYGVGYLAITSKDITFRLTATHKFLESKWDDASVFVSNRNNYPVGIGGEVFIPQGNAWVSYEMRGSRRSAKKFNTMKLFYTDAKRSSISYRFGGGKKEEANLQPGKGLKILTLKSGNYTNSVQIDFPTREQGYFFNVSLDGGNGIYIDNLPLRGNTGEDLQKIPLSILEGYNRELDYKLVILQFGKNAISANYKRYEIEMVQAIEHLKKAFPGAGFLLISVQDSGFKTSSRIINLLNAQKSIAKETNIAFWNLYEAMGGKNSMSKWVKANPPMASADHTHFNEQGAKVVGKLLADALLEAYNTYNRKN